jgi:hypothetical protein
MRHKVLLPVGHIHFGAIALQFAVHSRCFFWPITSQFPASRRAIGVPARHLSLFLRRGPRPPRALTGNLARSPICHRPPRHSSRRPRPRRREAVTAARRTVLISGGSAPMRPHLPSLRRPFLRFSSSEFTAALCRVAAAASARPPGWPPGVRRGAELEKIAGTMRLRSRGQRVRQQMPPSFVRPSGTRPPLPRSAFSRAG